MFYEQEFLNKLDRNRHRDIYARITLLTFDELPVEYIEGKVTGGSINIDGTSALRRTCNLTMVSMDLNINIFMLGLERKFILEIGLKNKVDDKYPDIIWFKQGVFITTGCNTARQTSNYQISLSGKDKMCLLNGDVGGTMPYSIDFATLEEISPDGTTITYTKVKIKDIIRNAVEEFGNEFPYNIQINDIEESGLDLISYQGDVPVYAFRNHADTNDATFNNLTFDDNTSIYTINEIRDEEDNFIRYEVGNKILIKDIDKSHFDSLVELDNIIKQKYYFSSTAEPYTMALDINKQPIYDSNQNPVYIHKTDDHNYYLFYKSNNTFIVKNQNGQIVNNEDEKLKPDIDTQKIFSIVKLERGDAVGYRQTDVVYAGELIANVGDSITSVLDKIIQMLVNYEYFYDVDGHFVFQKKKAYVTWGKQLVSESEAGLEKYFGNSKIESSIFYNFEDNDLIISFNNSPDFSNVKNDFSIWGTRKGVSGSEIPIHLRFALDRKPKSYTTFKPSRIKAKLEDNDDMVVYYELSDEEYAEYPQYTYIADEDGSFYFDKKDKTIIHCDWREIIYQMALDYHKFRDTHKDFYKQIIQNNLDENGMPLYPTGRTNYEQYYTDILGFWRDIFSPVGIDEYNETRGFFRQVLLSPSTYKKNTYYLKEDKVDAEIEDISATVSFDAVDRFPKYVLDQSRSFSEDKIYYECYEEIDEKVDSCFYKTVESEPYNLNFWFDFLDTTGDLGKYSVRAIGQRPKNVNNSNIKSIYYRQTPNFIFVDNSEKMKEEKVYNSKGLISEKKNIETYEINTAYTYISSTTALENCLTISSQGVSAMDELQNCLNEYTFCKENTTLTAIPIYYMEPNVRVAIKDEQSKVNGEYLVNKITLPLTYNGTMSLNVVKIVDDIY